MALVAPDAQPASAAVAKRMAATLRMVIGPPWGVDAVG
jgi:hypothetical protein